MSGSSIGIEDPAAELVWPGAEDELRGRIAGDASFACSCVDVGAALSCPCEPATAGEAMVMMREVYAGGTGLNSIKPEEEAWWTARIAHRWSWW